MDLSSSNTLPRRRVIAASWQRAAQGGLERSAIPAPRIADISESDPLLDAARPVLAHAQTMLADTNTALLLVDHECRLVAKVSGDSGLTRALDAAGLIPGAITDEATIGTNGLATPAEVRGAVTIHGSEHYLEQFSELSCYGEPIIHPTTNRLVGVLCLTETGEQASPLSMPVVRGLISGVTTRLLHRSHADQHAVLVAFERLSARRSEAIAALGPDVNLANARAGRLLTAADLGTLASLTDAADGTVLRLTLTSGLPAEVLVERVPGVASAAVFTVRPAPAPATSIPVTPVVTESIAITGDPGSGRTTRALSEVGDAPTRVLDVASQLISGAPLDVAGEIRAAQAASEALIVDGADLLDDRSIVLLTAAADSASQCQPLIVITGRNSGARPEIAALNARCRHQIVLPPLRHRTAELAALAQGFLDKRGGGLTMTAEAVDALVSQEWPGNLAELARVVGTSASAAASHNAQVIDVADLPPAYRASSRAARLSGREQAERQAVIDALAAAGGNKKHAANHLGVSRTTLYARIRALGINA